MSRSWNLPLEGAQTLSTSRIDINDSFDALLTNFIGTGDPVTGVADGMIAINTSSNKVRARVSGAWVNLGDWVAEMGHLRLDGTNTMSGDLNMGSNKIANLAVPTASGDAVRLADISGKLSRGGALADRTLEPGLNLRYTAPIVLTHEMDLANVSYTNTKLALTGGSLSGRADYGVTTFGSYADNSILRADEVKNLTTFNTSAGHNHDGSNARRIASTGISSAGLSANRMLLSDGASGSTWSLGPFGRVSGSYVGNFTSGRLINIGFQPNFIMVHYSLLVEEAGVPVEYPDHIFMSYFFPSASFGIYIDTTVVSARISGAFPTQNALGFVVGTIGGWDPPYHYCLNNGGVTYSYMAQ